MYLKIVEITLHFLHLQKQPILCFPTPRLQLPPPSYRIATGAQKPRDSLDHFSYIHSTTTGPAQHPQKDAETVEGTLSKHPRPESSLFAHNVNNYNNK